MGWLSNRPIFLLFQPLNREPSNRKPEYLRLSAKSAVNLSAIVRLLNPPE